MRCAVFTVAALAIIVIVEGARVEKIKILRGSLQQRKSQVTLSSLASSTNMDAGTGFRNANDNMFRSAKGVGRRRLVETYGGLDVFGATAMAETDLATGDLTGNVFGHVAFGLQNDIPDPDACQRPISEVLEIAIRAENYDINDPHIERKDGRRLVYVDPDSLMASLAYRVEFFYANQRVVSRPAYFIDACNSSVLLHFDQVKNVSLGREVRQDDPCPEPSECDPSAAGVGGNPKTGKITYNQNGLCLATEKSGDTCTMRNEFAVVIDNEQTTERDRTTPVSFTCDEGYDDGVNQAFGVASDALFYGTKTGLLYEEKYDMRALPYAPRLVVHFDSCFDNAFWDGTDMYFGDGCRTFYPLVNQDVVTHELAHGITTRNSDLVYALQPGGINEAFSDISGEIGDMFNRGSNDWLVGYELFKDEDRSLRYFINPPDDGVSIKHVRDYRIGMDVHFSSGVFNHAFYQLVAVEGMPIYDAYKCFLDANLECWGQSTRFWSGACCVMQMCYDNGFDHEMVRRAFRKVGIYLFLCDHDAVSTVIKSGETRSEVLVSASRNPILAVENKSGGRVSVTAEAADLSTVHMEVATESRAEDVFVSGSGSVDVESDLDTVYVRLTSSSADDIKVAVTVA
ncbi:elastase-like [Aplysia californica]|uniref:Elastase-like n=1 Tax=Aplysia californica TaxID=6500 RepID=A0ABM1VTH6_APLCA|nr:elastase-like [Aplysia californica]